MGSGLSLFCDGPVPCSKRVWYWFVQAQNKHSQILFGSHDPCLYLISIELTCIKYNTIYNLYVVMIALQRSNLAIRKGLTFGHAHPCLDAFITFTTDLQQDRHRWMQSNAVQLQHGSRKNAMFISYLTYLWYYNLFAWVNSVFVVANLLCCCIWK